MGVFLSRSWWDGRMYDDGAATRPGANDASDLAG